MKRRVYVIWIPSGGIELTPTVMQTMYSEWCSERTAHERLELWKKKHPTAELVVYEERDINVD